MRTPTLVRPPALDASWLRTAADLLRVVGLASLGWALLGHQWVDAALFALVMLGLVVPRILAVRAVLDLATGVAVLFAAWSAVLNLYVRYDWLDVVVHAVAGGLLTTVVHRLLVAASVLPPPGDRRLRLAGVGVVITFFSLGLMLGVLWEVGEWLGYTYLDPQIQVGYDDTMGDLVADGLGALVAGGVAVLVDRGSR